jgi:lipid II:glycine glycyltransferase (peptidoglycan interpeptide bridge formation enzyme)
VLDLRDGPEALRSGLKRSARRNLRLAEKAGLEVTRVADAEHLRAYYGLFELSIERWAGSSREPLALARWRAMRRDPLAKLTTIAEHLGDRFRLYLAWLDGEPIAGSIVLAGNSAHITRGAMDRDRAHETRAVTLVDWLAIEDAVHAGCPSFHFGESGTSAGLAQFKESFGARPVPYADVRVERMPITRADDALRTAVKRAIGFRDGE